MNGGWHDAGDLSQGLLNTGEATYAMFALADRLRREGRDPALVARLLEEARWGLDWVMKVRFDGGYRVVRRPGGEAAIERCLRDGSGAVALVSGPADAQVTTYFRRDPKGSATHVLDPAGRVLSQVCYDPYGQWRQVIEGLRQTIA